MNIHDNNDDNNEKNNSNGSTKRHGDSFSTGIEISVLEQWMVCNQLGGGQSHFIATHEDNLHLKLVPWAGVAALIKREDSNGNSLLNQGNNKATRSNNPLQLASILFPTFTSFHRVACAY